MGEFIFLKRKRNLMFFFILLMVSTSVVTHRCCVQDWEHRHEDDRLLIERILVLVRNVLHIPPNPAAEQRTDDDASVHDQVLWLVCD